MFFDRDANGIPRKWIQRIRRAMVTLVSRFTTDRMVKEYTRKYYLAKYVLTLEIIVILILVLKAAGSVQA